MSGSHRAVVDSSQYFRPRLKKWLIGRITLRRIRPFSRNEFGFGFISISIAGVALAGGVLVLVLSTSGAMGSTSTACTADVRNVQLAQQAYFDQTGEYSKTTLTLLKAGLLKAEPPAGEVTITITAGSPATASTTGSSSSSCAGFTG
jgi:hypothetical protein